MSVCFLLLLLLVVFLHVSPMSKIYLIINLIVVFIHIHIWIRKKKWSLFFFFNVQSVKKGLRHWKMTPRLKTSCVLLSVVIFCSHLKRLLKNLVFSINLNYYTRIFGIKIRDDVKNSFYWVIWQARIMFKSGV